MKTKKARKIIAAPDYHRNRAIEMGEMFGVWHAEFELGREGAADKRRMYFRRMLWHTRKFHSV